MMKRSHTFCGLSIRMPLLVSLILLTLTMTADSQRCSHGDLRLTHGESPLQGRVEICANGYWGSVCAQEFEWTHQNAKVVCRQLGRQLNITIIKAISRRDFYRSSSYDVSKELPVYLSDIQCSGTEDKLLNCSTCSIGSGSPCPFDRYCSNYGSEAGVSCIANDTDLLPACSSILSNFTGYYIPFVCTKSQKCLYSPQISKYITRNPYLCDGRSDCGDCSDECHCLLNYYDEYDNLCRHSSVPDTVCDCYDNEFKCKNGFCTLQNNVCNDKNNCGDGSDENTIECTAKRSKLLQNTVNKVHRVAVSLAAVWIAVLAALLLVWFLILVLCCWVQICPLHKVYYGKLVSGVADSGGRVEADTS